ncbi:MAG: effector [Candidatus Phytoplasma australasiaticum]|nr:effector [Candidatus Phytoplasma australasiaticum]MDV3199766.1 effector [Candidatus Phytoplasma australasiaticum]
MNKKINKKSLIIFLLLVSISIFYYILIIKKNNFLILNNLKNHISETLQKQPKSESKKEDNLKILNKYHNLLNFIEKIYLKYQNEIKKINNKLNLYNKDYLLLNKELHHYENLKKFFNKKTSQMIIELDRKKQILMENKIYSFKKASLIMEEQKLQEFKQKNDEMNKIIQAKKDQIQNSKIKIINLIKYKNIYYKMLYDLSRSPKGLNINYLTDNQ